NQPPAGRAWAPGSAPPAGALGALLGVTGAALLLAIAEQDGCTTGAIASAVRISAASASEHATVLRAAGLISTLRDRTTAIHSPTTAGLTLLGAGAA
ncbi:MarR family transcriptional regulator, partial [Kitasatospora sp. NPDC059747]|uniref:MarR family transcriptional regulator n=1 Tax=Kitasatospora sp. NPDC059747 TaxID=3346930 RepID=UPI00364BB14A